MELQSVNVVSLSEFQMALPSDLCRKQQLFASFAKTGHPMSKFTWGNLATLNLPNDPDGLKLNQRLHEFWKQYYTADRMTLVLQSKHSLDQLEEWAASIFHVILPSDNRIVSPNFNLMGSPYDTPNFNKIFQIIPVKDVNQVIFKIIFLVCFLSYQNVFNFSIISIFI